MSSAAVEFGAAWFQAKSVEGVRRLPVDERRRFFSMALEVTSKMNSRECAAVLRGKLDAVASGIAEIAIVQEFDLNWISTYLSITRMALIAELGKYPAFIPLTPSERRFAEEALSSKLIADLEKDPRSEFLVLGAELSPSAPDEAVCGFGLLVMNSALSLEGQVGDWVVRYLSES